MIIEASNEKFSTTGSRKACQKILTNPIMEGAYICVDSPIKMLYLVPTPLAIWKTLPRAIRVLGEVDQILAEDTRTSGVLLKHYKITTELKPTIHSMNTKL